MNRFIQVVILHIIAATFSSPAWAGDPFRSVNAKPIGKETEKLFELMFKEGNYPAAIKQVDKALRAEPNEPLAQGMKASLAYLEQDYVSMKVYALKTRSAAQSLLNTDQLRGRIYMAVSYLIEAGAIVKSEGVVNGAPAALGLVQKLFDEMKLAQAVDANDPEFNLIKGYMDMLIATVLPLSDLESALSSLRRSGPDYLKWRGIAIGYRDAKKNDEALDAINKALAAAPENPELNYLKGQILWQKNDLNPAKKEYRIALSKSKQLPPDLARQINGECSSITGSNCLKN